tara:strand:+ start:8979 stop:11675 length:2697 start_codon:yes stop_codon:yes gene_type:complete
LSKDYNETLNLPKTDFSMRANLPNNEPDLLSYWDSINLYGILSNKSGEKFELHDGPPFANGKIHIGHCLNKILKDIILKFNSVQGRSIAYTPGWDCHGLPIEHQVSKKIKTKDITKLEIRNLCEDFAMNFVNSQRDEFKRLGVISDWDNPYLTMSPVFESNQIRVFSEMYFKGYIYRGLKPVNWSPSSQTALAEAELEYPENHISKSVYVKFNLQENLKEIENVSLLIWTTTPWTLPANKAVSVNKNFTYGIYELENENLIIETSLSKIIEDKLGKSLRKVHELMGQDLLSFQYISPISNELCPVLEADYVTRENGTGLVHTAPGHGTDDYMTGVKNNINIFSPVDKYGKFTDEVPERFQGLNVLKEGNQEVVNYLSEVNHLLLQEDYNHKYPYDWRTGKPTIFRSTYQWFSSVDKFKLNALDEINKVSWYPTSSIKRISNMVSQRSDWCISRQRSWGLPIPVFYYKDSNDVFINEETISQICEIFEKEGSSSWWSRDIADFLPFEYKKLANELVKGTDTLDVWFDSGTSWKTVLDSKDSLPADLYLEGNDQHRGWFQSSLLTCVAVNSISPYKSVLTHGFVVDSKGQKMSKSKNNVIDPQKIINSSGADILRLWVASEDYSSEIRISDSIIEGIKDKYKKLRNTLRFLLGNISDFDYSNKFNFDHLEEFDKWILIKLSKMKMKYIESFNNYSFHNGISHVLNFTANDLSSIYLDIQKDILYTFSSKSKVRLSCQSALFILFKEISLMLAPVLSFTAEEAWKSSKVSDETIFNETLFLDNFHEDELEKKWDKIFSYREPVLKEIELLRSEKIIGSSLEADILLNCNKQDYIFLSENLDNFQKSLMVAKVDLVEEEVDDLKVAVNKTIFPKCVRCWNYTDLRSDVDPNICSKCQAQLNL